MQPVKSFYKQNLNKAHGIFDKSREESMQHLDPDAEGKVNTPHSGLSSITYIKANDNIAKHASEIDKKLKSIPDEMKKKILKKIKVKKSHLMQQEK